MSGTRIEIPNRNFYGVCKWCLKPGGTGNYVSSPREWIKVRHDDPAWQLWELVFHQACFRIMTEAGQAAIAKAIEEAAEERASRKEPSRILWRDEDNDDESI